MRSLTRITVCFSISLVAGGCGIEKSSAPPPSAAAPSAPPVAPVPVVSGPARSKPAPQSNRKGTPTADKRSAHPDVPPEMLFEIGQGIPNFELLPRNEASPDDVYALVTPGIGENASTVTLVPPATANAYSGTGSGLALPTGFTAVPRCGYSPEGLARQIVCQKDGSTMALIPGGLYSQGIDGKDPNAAPMHPVELSPYYMDITEVTLDQYLKFRADQKPTPGRPGNESAPGSHPALGLAWRDATAYCKWAGKELPTEAEWEQAARGPNDFVYPWGNDPRVVWQRARTPQQIDPVGSFLADRSPYGIFDLAGNAREWCADYYADDAYLHASKSDGTAVTDWSGPTRPSLSGHRVVRGSAPSWQLWYRSSASMSEQSPTIGFRGVVHLKAAKAGATASGEPGTDNAPPPTVAPRAGRSERGTSRSRPQ